MSSFGVRPFLPEIKASRESIGIRIAEDAKCITAETKNSAGRNAHKISINLQSRRPDRRPHFESRYSTGDFVRSLGPNIDNAPFIYWWRRDAPLLGTDFRRFWRAIRHDRIWRAI